MSDKPLFSVNLSEENTWRRDLVINALKKYKLLTTSKMLEIGTGNGKYGFLLSTYFEEYYGIDPDQEYLEIAKNNIKDRENVHYEVGSAENIPFDLKFDFIFYARSWHFIKNFKKAIEEATRVLTKDGVLIIIEPQPHVRWNQRSLQKDSPEFNQKTYDHKIKSLELAKKEIETNPALELLERISDVKTSNEIYVLKLKN